MQALDPLTGLNVKVRRFEAADDEQALLMESFTSQQLTLYKLQTEDMLAQLNSHARASHVVSTEPQEPATSSDTSSAGTAAHPACTALSDKIRWVVGLCTHPISHPSILLLVSSLELLPWNLLLNQMPVPVVSASA